MSRVLLTGGPGLFSRLANVRLLAATREVRGMEESRRRLPEEPATMDVREVQPSRGASIVAADLDHHAESLDAVAGSEFVDDRIRLRE
jgi:hypothetical protein